MELLDSMLFNIGWVLVVLPKGIVLYKDSSLMFVQFVLFKLKLKNNNTATEKANWTEYVSMLIACECGYSQLLTFYNFPMNMNPNKN